MKILSVKTVNEEAFKEISQVQSIEFTPSGVLVVDLGREQMFFAAGYWQGANLREV